MPITFFLLLKMFESRFYILTQVQSCAKWLSYSHRSRCQFPHLRKVLVLCRLWITKALDFVSIVTAVSFAANDWRSRIKASVMYHKSASRLVWPTLSGHRAMGEEAGKFTSDNAVVMFRGGRQWCPRRGCGCFGDYPWCAEATGTCSGATTSQSICVQGSESLSSKSTVGSCRADIILSIQKSSNSITCTSLAATMNRQSRSPPG
jgi:hypothetical protein